MQKYLGLLLLLFTCNLKAQVPMLVTGTITDSGGNVATSGTVTFALQPASQTNPYRVIGSSIIAPTTTLCSISNSGSPNLSCYVWSNDLITPSGTAYQVTFKPKGITTQVWNNVYINNGPGSYDLNTPKFAPPSVSTSAFVIPSGSVPNNLYPSFPNSFSLGTQALPWTNVWTNLINGLPFNNNSKLSVNSSTITNPNLNDSTPTPSVGYVNGLFQVNGSDVSVQVPIATSPRPNSSTALCFFSPFGDDANDGLDTTKPKKYGATCYNQLPANGGTIKAMDGGSAATPAVWCPPSSPADCGVWILPHTDPNYSTPPNGWLKAKYNVVLEGYAGGAYGGLSFAAGGHVYLKAGSATDPTLPGFWLSGTEQFTVRNIYNNSCFPVKMGFDSTGAISAYGFWNKFFQNDYFYASHVSGCGPVMYMTGESAWTFYDHLNFSDNPTEATSATVSRSSNTVTISTSSAPASWTSTTLDLGLNGCSDSSFNGTFSSTYVSANSFTFTQTGPNTTATGCEVTSDKAAAVLIKTASGPGPGLQYFTNIFLAGGGIKLYPSANNGGGVVVEKVLQEAGYEPAVWISGCTTPTFGGVKNIAIDDNSIPLNGARWDCSSAGVNVFTAENTDFQGPFTLLGGNNPSQYSLNPLLQGTQGTFNGYLLSQTNAARRGFGPVAARFTNLISAINPIPCVGATLTCIALAAPDGTNNALSVTTSNSVATETLYDHSSITTSVGDIFICAGWFKSLSPPGFFAAQNNLGYCTLNTGTTVYTSFNIIQHGIIPDVNTQGEWVWSYQIQKVSYISASTLRLQYLVGMGSAHGVGIFAPVAIHIPVGTISDNEAIEYAQSLQSFRPDATLGQTSLLPGEQFLADYITTGTGGTVKSDNFCIGSSCITSWPAGGGGSGVTAFTTSGGGLSPLFTTTVTNGTTTPDLTFTIANGAINKVIASPASGSTGALTLRSLVANDFPSGTVNTQTCGPGITCVIPLTVNGVGNTSQNGLDIINSTANSVGLSFTISNTSANHVKGEISGVIAAATSAAKLNSGTIPTSATIVGTNSSLQIVDASSATLSNNTTGRSNTTLALASTPTQCGANVPSTGIAASGNANCTSTPVLGDATATSLIVSGTLDGRAPITQVTTASFSIGATRSTGYYFNVNSTANTNITGTLPTSGIGKQYCFANVDDLVTPTPETGTIRINTSASGQYIHFNGAVSNSGGYIISSGVAGDKGCIVGMDTTNWMFYPGLGTWTLN